MGLVELVWVYSLDWRVRVTLLDDIDGTYRALLLRNVLLERISRRSHVLTILPQLGILRACSELD